MAVNKLKFLYKFSRFKPNKILFSDHLLLNSTWLQYTYSATSRGFTFNVFSPKMFWVCFFSNSLVNSTRGLFYIMDGFFFPGKNCSSINFQYNCNDLITSSRINVATTVSLSNFSLSSVSCIYSSTIWLERELSDFSNILFFGLSDTRRLLLDYFEVKGFWQTHISNDKNFNNLVYDINILF